MTLHLDPRALPRTPAINVLDGHSATATLALRTRPAVDPSLPLHDARALTGGGSLAAIDLDGQTYTLRITRQGKLILTK